MADAAACLPAADSPQPGVGEAQVPQGLGEELARVRDAVCHELAGTGVSLPGSPAAPEAVAWGPALLGGERPVIAVATTAGSAPAVAAQAVEAARAGADVVEIRLDLLEGAPELGVSAVAAERWAEHAFAVAAVAAQALREAGARDFPLLLTVRTAAEGGGLAVEDAAYAEALAALIQRVAGEPSVRAIDVERARGCLPRLSSLAHDHGLTTVASAHFFHHTPPAEDLLALFEAMAADGADVVKIAAMPTSQADVAAMLAASCRARAALRVPAIAISMGELGMITRLAGGLFGSTLTFATAGNGASAPGQLPIDEVRRFTQGSLGS